MSLTKHISHRIEKDIEMSTELMKENNIVKSYLFMIFGQKVQKYCWSFCGQLPVCSITWSMRHCLLYSLSYSPSIRKIQIMTVMKSCHLAVLFRVFLCNV